MIDRRQFLKESTSCAAHLALAASLQPLAARRLFAQPTFPVAAREPFGSLERIADDVWALISTPLNGDRTTLSNGGFIAGRSGLVAVEGFFQPRGAQWLSERAQELTGRWPTHVVLTHYHADHANGIAGYTAPARPAVYATERTRTLVLEKNTPQDAERRAALQDAILLPATQPTVLDLGGRVVRIVPRTGHTESDVTVELDDPGVVFAGDLLWNGMFPNFVDTTPTKLTAAVRALRRQADGVYVPGHGAVARNADVDRYLSMLEEVERAARAAHQAGTPPGEAAAAFMLPPALGEWTLFNRAFFERAFAAWHRELSA